MRHQFESIFGHQIWIPHEISIRMNGNMTMDPIIICYSSQQGKLQLRLEQLELGLLAAIAQYH